MQTLKDSNFKSEIVANPKLFDVLGNSIDNPAFALNMHITLKEKKCAQSD